jgi:hypothetical protein
MQLNVEDGVELVGLRGCSNGRSCFRHTPCGDQVTVGTRIRFISTTLGCIYSVLVMLQ